MFQNGPGAKALLTDLYEITMAYGYWKAGMADQEAVFCQGRNRMDAKRAV